MTLSNRQLGQQRRRRKYYTNMTEQSLLIILAAAWGASTPLTLAKLYAIHKDAATMTRSYFTVRHNLYMLTKEGRVTASQDIVTTLPTGGGDNRKVYTLSDSTLVRLSRKAARLSLEFDHRTDDTRHAPVPSLKDY